jgi:amidase
VPAFDEAFSAARVSEARYRDGKPRPLEGITVAVKEEYENSGWAATVGSLVYENRIADQTHPVLDKLREAGAVLHIQTTAPELFLVGITWSDLWGITRNPWNPAFTPGGSSGGSAAALAAGMATLAIGSDMEDQFGCRPLSTVFMAQSQPTAGSLRPIQALLYRTLRQARSPGTAAT